MNETMEIQQIDSEIFRKLMDAQKIQIEATTKKFVDSEMALFEFKLCASSLGDEHIEKANRDVLAFNKEIMVKAKNLQEYKKLVNFI